MSNVTIEVFPASEGDAFLVSTDSCNILIDAGVYKTYHDYIKNRLLTLSEHHRKLDLLVITHIDRDHIEGAIELLKENGESSSPLIIPIDQVWHNSYRHLQFSRQNNVGHTENEILRNMVASGMPKGKSTTVESRDISAVQGSTLAVLILSGGYPWNSSLGGQAISTDIKSSISFPHFTVKLISPNTKKLDALGGKWETQLRKTKHDFIFGSDSIFDDALEFSMRMESYRDNGQINKSISEVGINLDLLVSSEESSDTSVTNGSSIAFVLEIAERKLLFLGDAHPDLVVEQLQKMTQGEESPLYFDLVKISHHGSAKNTNTRLLDIINSPNYVISTDGTKHGHPDMSTLAKLVAKSSEGGVNIYCNYRSDNAVHFNKFNLGTNYNCSFIFPEHDDILTIKL